MGVLRTRVKKITYHHELINHSLFFKRTESELPVKKLDAVFLESAGTHPKRTELEELLNKLDHNYVHDMRLKIINQAKDTGTEIWFGDVKPQFGEMVKSILANFLHPFEKLRSLYATLQLSKRGDTNQKYVETAARFEKKVPLAFERDKIMGAKILRLAAITKAKKIGIVTGAAHVNLSKILEQEETLNEETRDKIASRGGNALKMYRCKYNKEAKRWHVEEHSL